MISDDFRKAHALRIAIEITILTLLFMNGAWAEDQYEFVLGIPSQQWFFSYPSEIALDNNGNVYVADRGNNRIQKFSSLGTFLAKWGNSGIGDGQFDNPMGIAVDNSGNVYVADTGNDRIQKFSSSGDFLAQWGTSGGGDGQFNLPAGIAVDSSGNVYVADPGISRIQKFSSSGDFLAKWGSNGSADGQFYWPYGITVDNSGNVYVADTGNNRIQKFSSSGAFLAKWGSYGSADGQFNYPYGIAVDNSGNIYVSDSGNNRIQKISSSGDFIAKWESSGPTWGIAVDSSGNVYVADTHGSIQKFSSSGYLIAKWGSSGSADGQFNNPFGIAVDSSGNMYVADRNNYRIQKFSSSGDFIAKWGSSGSGDGQFNAPYGIAVDSNGNVYVADPGNNRIQKFSSSGGFLNKWGSSGSGDGQFNAPCGIAVDSNGNVYVADYGNSRIQKFSSSGIFLAKWGSYGSADGQFFSSIGITVDRSGNVYVAENFNNRIQKFSSTGTFLGKWGSSGSGDGQFSAAWGIAVDGSGNVYVADSNNNRIQKFSSSGAFLTKLGNYGSDDGQFNNPIGLSVDSSGNVYVADTYNHRIQKFRNSAMPMTGSIHNINKSTNYTTIQEAIDDASPGDEIRVDSGTYYENVNVNKRLTLRGIGMPVVDAGGSGSGIILNAGNSVLEGFMVTNTTWPNMGIRVNSSNNILRNNNASNNWYGIFLSSTNCTLIGNNASFNNYYGIYMSFSPNTLLKDNIARFNGHGIGLSYSNNSNLQGNIASDNRNSVESVGISLYNSNNNTLSANMAMNNNMGSEYAGQGIYLTSSNNNIIIYNNVSNNGGNGDSGYYGFGIILYSSSNNTLSSNNVSNNYYQAYDYNGINLWDNGYPSGGNYWSDYKGIDLKSGPSQNIPGSDGIGDTPYNISGGAGAQDRYPLMVPYTGLPPTNQFKSDGTTPIATGSSTNEKTVIFKGKVSDSDSDKVKLQIELRLTDEYGGNFDEKQGGLKNSSLVTSGSEVSITVNDLLDGNYHWRVRAIDEHENKGEWVEFGGNPTSDADFIIIEDIKKRINTESLNLNIEYTVMEMPIGMLPWDYDTYLGYFYDAIKYRTVAGTSLAQALKLARSGNFENAELYLGAARQSNINSLTMYTNSLNYYQSSISWSMFVAKTVKDVSFFAVSVGVNVISPGSGYYVDMFFTGVDFWVDSNLYGIEPAAKNAFTKATMQTVFQKIPISEFGGVTMETYIQNMQGDQIIPAMNNLFTSEQGKYYLIEAVKDAVVLVGLEDITEEVAQSLGTEMAEKYIEIVNNGMLFIKAKSPGELRVYDSKGNVAGLVDGKIYETIPNSIYDENSETVIILVADDDYRYEFKGNALGTYGMDIIYSKGNNYYPISLNNIPISLNEIHDYSINWNNFANGEKAITLKVDSNGDGIPEETINKILPTASLNYSPEKPVIVQNISFDASSSNGSLDSYKWEFGDGTNALGKSVNHSYSSGGVYTVNLTVKDDNNAIDTKQKMIFVSLLIFPGMTNPPTDPDGDGLYEDINGNRRKDFNDVVMFFNYLEWVTSNEPISNFDFNGNGRVDFNDIIKLFEEL